MRQFSTGWQCEIFLSLWVERMCGMSQSCGMQGHGWDVMSRLFLESTISGVTISWAGIIHRQNDYNLSLMLVPSSCFSDTNGILSWVYCILSSHLICSTGAAQGQTGQSYASTTSSQIPSATNQYATIWLCLLSCSRLRRPCHLWTLFAYSC